jgi:hypothetical protein
MMTIYVYHDGVILIFPSDGADAERERRPSSSFYRDHLVRVT